MLAPALQWGLFAMKVILATQGTTLITVKTLHLKRLLILSSTINCLGLGGVVPQIDLLSSFSSETIDSMTNQILTEGPSLVTNAANSLQDHVRYNDEQAKAAYSAIYKFISDQEGGGGPNWIPSMTGLYRTTAPLGKGRSMWISPAGKAQFEMYGEDAVKRIGVNK